MIVTVQKKKSQFMSEKKYLLSECVKMRKNGYENEILNDDAIIIIARQNDLSESPKERKINIFFYEWKLF